jgi:flavin-dependent dehydrogenase
MAADTPAIRSTTFHYSGETLGVTIKPEHDVDCLYAPRRTVLDRLLVDAARNAGADIRHGVLLSGVLFSPDGRVIGASLTDESGSRTTVHADIVIGADGRKSSVAQLVNTETYVACANSCGIIFGYFENLPQDGFHWYYSDGAAAGVIPTNGGHCVFAAVPTSEFRATIHDDVTRGFLTVLAKNDPELRAAVERGRLIGHLRGLGGTPGYLRRCQGPGWALVGDAGYFKDPLTAHGITDAFRDAELLACAVADGGTQALQAYQRERDELSMPFLSITDAIASFSWDLAEIKQLHADLSAVMKVETNHLAGMFQVPSLAA